LLVFEPTFFKKGFLYRQVAVKPSLHGWTVMDWKGRQKVGCGYPPSIARSQKARGGTLGVIQKIREQSERAAFYIAKDGPETCHPFFE